MKTFLLYCIIFLSRTCLFSQDQTIDSITQKENISEKITHSFLKTGALVSYYFWEEDSAGFIINNEIKKPFLQNYYITCSSSNLPKDTVDFLTFTKIIKSYVNDVTKNDDKKIFDEKENLTSKCFFPLHREAAEVKGSVIQVKKNQEWSSKKKGSVLYISISIDNKWKFYKSSDSIILTKNSIAVPSNGQYIVFTYLKENSKKVIKEEVYTYAGENVTDFFLHAKTIDPQRVIVFANGYRGHNKEKDESDNLVVNKDRFYYWYKIDNQFIERLQTAAYYYVDGSMSIKTSNHRSNIRFLMGYLRSKKMFGHFRKKRKKYGLKDKSNLEGFARRKEQGRIAGKALLEALCNSPACQQTIDTIDIVCHSMGYAYALGLIEEIKNKVTFGKIYILAPENASADNVDWNLFEEVWQYGSNSDDPLWEQDGIAPQTAVKGIENLPLDKGGRLYFPVDWPLKNFVDSHQLYNYDWIFERINKGEKGYICR